MSGHSHVVVWIDHREARVIFFNAEEAETHVVHAHDRHAHLHHKANSLGSGHAAEDHNFLEAVSQAMAGAREALIAGPGSAKTELMKHIQNHTPDLARAILGVETLDHPTDGELVGHARKFFHAADRRTPQMG